MSNVLFDLRAARINAGLSQAELGELVGVQRETVRRLEHGFGVQPRNAKKIADHFGVRVTDLMPVRKEPV